MEEENIETTDSQNGEVEEVIEEETVDSLKAKNQSLYEQLKKAKGFERDEEGHWVKPEPKTEPKEIKSKKSDDLDYGQKAFLVANGVKGEAETKLVREAMRESGKTLEQVLESKYFQSELENMRELAKTKDATPTGRRTSNASVDSVEYWMSKPIADVPKEMRIKVVNARLEKESGKGAFYNS